MEKLKVDLTFVTEVHYFKKKKKKFSLYILK